MKIELNKDEVKHGIIMYLKEACGIDAAAKDIKLDDSYGRLASATWEKEENTDGE